MRIIMHMMNRIFRTDKFAFIFTLASNNLEHFLGNTIGTQWGHGRDKAGIKLTIF